METDSEQLEVLVTPCPKCGSLLQSVGFTGNQTGHYAYAKCQNIDCRHHRFLARPDNERVKRPAAHRKMAKRTGLKHCEMCGIVEGDLPSGQALEGHHRVFFVEGGEATKENTLVLCTACHKLWHWRRTWSVSEPANMEGAA